MSEEIFDLTVPYGEILSEIFCVRPSTQKDFESFPRVIDYLE